MKKKLVTRYRTIDHVAPIPVVENVDQRMYLREGIAEGTADDGTPIEICTTGPSIVIQLGRFPNGRQFVVSIADMATAVLSELTKPTVGGAETTELVAKERR